MEAPLFIRLRKKLRVKPRAILTLGDVCQLYWDGVREKKLATMPLYQIKEEDGAWVVIDIMQVIAKLRTIRPELPLEVQGPTQIIVEVLHPQKKPNLLLVALVWLVLFFGAGMAIMNFHADVSMAEVHSKIYYLITGRHSDQPLLLQIPYSFGIGMGMVLFFNHIFQRRINEEPSPLDVELFLYEQNLEQYFLHHENKENNKTKR